VRQVVPFRTALEGATKGGMPEVLQTSYGSLTVGLDAKPRQILRQAERRVGPGPVEAECCNFDQHLFRSRCQDRQVGDLKSVCRPGASNITALMVAISAAQPSGPEQVSADARVTDAEC
jgi:hypothetical protein